MRLVTSDWHLRARGDGAARGGRAAARGAGRRRAEHAAPADTLVNEYNKLLLRRVALWVGLMIDWLRTLLFDIFFYGGSVPIIVTVPISGLFGRRAMIRHATLLVALPALVRARDPRHHIRIEGARPDRPALYAAKHQAFFEAIDLESELDGPAMVLKRELPRHPGLGLGDDVYGALVVDREASDALMRQMMREASAAKAQGRSILIFPEGTRVPPRRAAADQTRVRGAVRAPEAAGGADRGRQRAAWPKRGRSGRGHHLSLRRGDPAGPAARGGEAAGAGGDDALEAGQRRSED